MVKVIKINSKREDALLRTLFGNSNDAYKSTEELDEGNIGYTLGDTDGDTEFKPYSKCRDCLYKKLCRHQYTLSKLNTIVTRIKADYADTVALDLRCRYYSLDLAKQTTKKGN